MKTRLPRKALSFFLSLVMMLSLLPTMALAEGETTPVAKIGDTGYASLADAVSAANVEDTIEITVAGEYTIPGISKNITIKGTVDGVVFNCVGSGSIASVNGATFENVTMNFGTSAYHGFQHAGTINMKNCVLNGLFYSYGEMKFDGCTFNAPGSEYSMWCYAGDVSYTNCIVNCAGKFANVYNEGNDGGTPWKITATGCTFNSTKINKAAFNVKETCGNKMLKYDVTISACTCNENFPAASADANGALYVISPLVQVDDRNLQAESTGIKVTLDGEEKYPVAEGETSVVDLADVTDGDRSIVFEDVEGLTEDEQKAIVHTLVKGSVATTEGATNVSEVVGVETLSIQLTNVAAEKDEEQVKVNSITFDVTPKDASGEAVSKPASAIKFRLPLTNDFTVYAKVEHEGDADRYLEVKGENGAKYCEVEADHFSLFTASPVNEVPAANVAQIGETKYTTLADALAAWDAGETLTLLANVTSATQKVVGNGDYVLNLGEYTWTAQNCNAIWLGTDGNLTVNAGSNGGITATDNYCIKAYGTGTMLNINGGTYTGDISVESTSTTTTVHPGVKVSNLICVHDGERVAFDDVKAIVYDNGYYTYLAAAPESWEAKVNAAAVCTYKAASGAGPQWQSIADYGYTGDVYFAKADIAFDLYTDIPGDAMTPGTKKCYADNKITFVADNCTFTLNNGVTTGINLTINGAHTVTVDASASGASYTGTVTLKNESAKFVEKYGSNTEYADTKVTKGGSIGADKIVAIDKATENQKTFTIADYYACQVMQEGQPSYVAITKEEAPAYYAKDELWIYTRTQAKLYYGGLMFSEHAKQDGTQIPEYIKATDTEVYYVYRNGSVYTYDNVTGKKLYEKITEKWSNVILEPGQPVFFVLGTAEDKEVNYKTFAEAYAVASGKTIILLDNLAPEVKLGAGDSFTVDCNGFTFTDTGVTAVDGYKVVKTENDDGWTYTVVPCTYVAQIGDTKYETYEEALNAAQPGQTVEILIESDEPISLNNGKAYYFASSNAEKNAAVAATGLVVLIEDSSDQEYTYQADGVIGYSYTSDDAGECIYGGIEALIDAANAGHGSNTSTLMNAMGEGGYVYYDLYESWTLSKNETLWDFGAAGSFICTYTESTDPIVIDLNGHNIEQMPGSGVHGVHDSLNGYPAIEPLGGKLVIKDGSNDANGKIIGAMSALKAYDSVVELQSGTISSKAVAYTGGDAPMYGDVVEVNKGSTFTMSGGELTFEFLEDDEAEPEIAVAPIVVKGDEAVVKVTGGTIKSLPVDLRVDPESNGVATGMTVDTSKAKVIGWVAKIGDKYYETLADVAAAAQDGETVTILADCSAETLALNSTITVDLNGKKVTLGATSIAADKVVTIQDNATTKGGLVCGGTITVNGTLDVSALSYGTTGLIGGQPGTLAVSSTGKVALMSAWDSYSAAWLDANSSAFFAGTVDGAKIVKSDGTTRFVRQDGKWVVENAVAQIKRTHENGNVYYETYATLADAIDAVQNGETIVMLKDITVDSGVENLEGKTFTIDLNGTTLTTTKDDAFTINNTNLTVKNGTITHSTTWEPFFLNGENAGSLTLDTVTITSPEYSVYVSSSSKNKTVNIENSNLTSTGDGVIYASGKDASNSLSIINSSLASSNAETAVLQIAMKATLEKVNITSTSATAVVCYENTDLLVKGTENSFIAAGGAISTNGSKDLVQITIEGGTFKSTSTSAEDGIAFYHPDGSPLTIKGGTFEGATALYVKGGVIDIQGGSFIGTGAYAAAQKMSSGAEATGDAVVIEASDYLKSQTYQHEKNPNVTISSGFFKSTNGSPIAYYTFDGNAEAHNGKMVSGGYFNKEISANIIVDGKTVIDTPNGEERTAGYLYTIGIAPVAPAVDTTATEQSTATAPTGEGVDADLAEKVVEEVIGEITKNTAVSGEGATNIQSSEVETALKSVSSLNELVDSTSQLKITVKSVATTTTATTVSTISATTVTTTSAKYDVKPYVTVKTTNESGDTVTETRQITNEELAAAKVSIKFRLAVPESMKSNQVLVKHYKDGEATPDWSKTYAVQSAGSDRYVELEANSFSTYEVEDLVVQGYVALNVDTSTPYTMLSSALAEATTDQTVILLKSVSVPAQVVIVNSGVTLDLQGHSITEALFVYVTGNLIDTSASKGVVSATTYYFSEDANSKYLAIYNGTGYSFYNLSVASGKVTGTPNKFGFYLKKTAGEFASAIDLIKSNVGASKVKAIAVVKWTDDEGNENKQDIICTDEIMRSYILQADSKQINITIKGVESLEAVSDVTIRMGFKSVSELLGGSKTIQ